MHTKDWNHVLGLKNVETFLKVHGLNSEIISSVIEHGLNAMAYRIAMENKKKYPKENYWTTFSREQILQCYSHFEEAGTSSSEKLLKVCSENVSSEHGNEWQCVQNDRDQEGVWTCCSSQVEM